MAGSSLFTGYEEEFIQLCELVRSRLGKLDDQIGSARRQAISDGEVELTNASELLQTMELEVRAERKRLVLTVKMKRTRKP